MKTIFIDECDDNKEYHDMAELPMATLKTLVRGPWGSRRVREVVVRIYRNQEPEQIVYLGLVNIHG